MPVISNHFQWFKKLLPNWRFRLFTAIATIMSSAIFIGLYINYTSVLPSGRRALYSAQIKWQTHPIEHYRIVINNYCDVEVRNEQVIKSYKDNCDLTVSNLLARVESSLNIKWLNGFGCDVMVVYPVFNETWGYPEKIEYRQENASPLNIGLADYLSSRSFGNPLVCSMVGYYNSNYIIQSFTPLP